MRRYRICENKKGQFKIQFKVLGLFWWSWKEHYQGIVKMFATHKEAEKYIRKLRLWKETRRINKIEENSWRCRGEFNND